MTTTTIKAFLDAADDLLTAQQALLPVPLAEDIRALTEAYLEARAPLLYRRRSSRRQSAAIAADVQISS